MHLRFDDYLLKFVRVTEAAALGAYSTVGLGDPRLSDHMAVRNARSELNRIDMRGSIVVGEGERDDAPMLFIGENLGNGQGIELDIAIDPLECTTFCAHGKQNSMSSLAFGRKGALMAMPDIYMEKIAVNVPVLNGEISLLNSVENNLVNLAKLRDCAVNELRVVILNRERHKKLIESVRASGARVISIEDGDIYGIISVATGSNDMYIGIGGSPEGVLAAAALKGIGGFMETRLIINTPNEEDRANKLGISDMNAIYKIEHLVRDEAVFIATGITSGELLDGIQHHSGNVYSCHSLIIAKNHTMAIEHTLTYNE